ncbi:uncharacterized protein LOC108858060 [Raphanus sativus]|uniref:Uncharacterized protein LOC108858060 n=1 Tax=Raphanus sativus TaxID=3726 RepID=A0A6J0NRZ8_RAPSA|nr:uncharacterized protein LOC108858060 [Raphanus sativus]
MMFRNRDSFKQHMAMFAIANKFCYRNAKSDPTMMVLKCISSSCQWRVYAIRLKDSDVFEVRKVDHIHTCSIADRGGYQSQATSAVIGELMKTKYAGNGLGPKPNEIRRMMRGDHDVCISYWKAWKSRDMAVDSGHGTCNDSYRKLPGYLNNLVLANPGSLANLHTQEGDGGGHRFKYMFLALGACVEGYKYMRKVVVVDGTHLKGRYAGCLLTASAEDGNHQIFPLACAVVDSENDKSWEWFFQNLAAFVPNESGLVLMSDRHPSIYKAISQVYPSAGHCICVVHLKRNIRTNFRERHLGHLVAKTARAYRLNDFYVTFSEIKAMDPSCAAYLIEIGFENWSRSHFPGNRYNVMTSNLAESWNSVLCKRRDVATKSGGDLTPRIEEMVRNNFEKTGGYHVLDIAEMEYAIRNKSGASFHVNLDRKTCSCFEFQMLGIPCSHAIAAALKGKMSVNDLVIDEYKIDFLKRAYQGTIVPESDSTGGIQILAVLNDLQLRPPATRRPPGRPKKLRYFSRGEKRVKCGRRRITCNRCKGVGHNKATCKNPI